MRFICSTLIVMLLFILQTLLMSIGAYQWKRNLCIARQKILLLPHKCQYQDEVFPLDRLDRRVQGERRNNDVSNKKEEKNMINTFALKRAISQFVVAIGIGIIGIGESPGIVLAAIGNTITDPSEEEAVEILNPIEEVGEFLNFGKNLKTTKSIKKEHLLQKRSN